MNEFCPTKFDGKEKRMAEYLVDTLDSANTYKSRYERLKREFELYRENH